MSIILLSINYAYSAPQGSLTYTGTLLPVNGDNLNDIGTSTSQFRNLYIGGLFTNSGVSDGCATWSSGVLTSLGIPCGSGGGGGGGGGTFSTTTVGGLLQYPYTALTTSLDSSSTSTSKWWYSPVLNVQYLNGRFGIGTTSPYAPLSVVGQVVGSWFTSTSTTQTNTFPQANITKFSNLTSNGLLRLSNSDGTASVDTTTYESGLTAGDGLTRTVNDFDCDIANSSTFGCLTSADWTTFNNKQASGNYMTALTGDVTASGPGSAVATLATVNSNVGTYTNANITVNAKGLVTAVSNGSGGGGGGTGVGWLWNSINSLYQSTTTDDILAGAIATSSTAKLEVIAGGTKPAAYFKGNVGVGTSSPYAMLSVAGETVARNFIATSSAATSTFAGGVGIGSTTPYEKVGITGNVVIDVGALAPIYFGQNKSSSTYNLISFNGGMTDATFQGFGGGGSSTFYMQSMGDLSFRTGGTNTRMYITSTGNVGIGTTSPYSKLAIEGTTGLTLKYTGVNTPGFLFTNSSGSVSVASNVDQNGVVQDSSKYQWQATMSQASDSWGLYRSPAGATWSPVSMLYVDNMGDLGLGTTSPYAKLSVVGQAVAAYFTATTSTASTFPYASSTALTVSGAFYNTSLADGCANITSGKLGSTGSACGSGGGGVSGGTAGMLASWTNSTTLTATGTPTAASYVATSSTATSTFAGGVNIQGQVGVGTSSPVAGPTMVFNAGSTILCPQVLLATSTSMTISMNDGCHVVLRMGTSNATITMTGGYAGSLQTQTLCNPNAFGGAVTYTNVLYGTDATAVSNSTTTNVCTRNIIEKTMATSTDIYRVIGQQIIK